MCYVYASQKQLSTYNKLFENIRNIFKLHVTFVWKLLERLEVVWLEINENNLFSFSGFTMR